MTVAISAGSENNHTLASVPAIKPLPAVAPTDDCVRTNDDLALVGFQHTLVPVGADIDHPVGALDNNIACLWQVRHRDALTETPSGSPTDVARN